MENKKTSLSYRDAGVDIDAGNLLVERIKPFVNKTKRAGLLGGLGGFGGFFEIPTDRYKQPVLVSSTDGVGTKLKLAIALEKHDTIGIDLVAMCANDLVVAGAEPLYFLDYYATSQLDIGVATDVIKGIAAGCEKAGMALIGGETAEMPDMYQSGDYDVAGFCVGVVEKSAIIDGSKVKKGDAIVGIASSGIHSNGYSLVRKVLSMTQTHLDEQLHGEKIGDILLAPTKIYVKPLLQLLHKVPVHALAHITGGGLLENIPRVLPDNLCAHIHASSWIRPHIFDWLQEQGNITDEEMHRTFNNGIGMVVCVDQEHLATALTLLHGMGELAWHIGDIKTCDEKKVIIA